MALVTGNYAGAQLGQANALNQPKELGILQRADGLRSGLQSLRSRLESLSDRLDGNGSETTKGLAPVSCSLSGTVSDAEGELRICLQMVDALSDRF